MKYSKQIILKNGSIAVLRNGVGADGSAVFDNFNQTHAETDYLISYPDKAALMRNREASFWRRKRPVTMKLKSSLLWTGR